jgi:hypothetical protein
MAPSFEEAKRKNDVKISEILSFFDNHHDIMIFADKTTGSFTRKLANEFHVDFDDYVIIIIKSSTLR